ncbi:serine hydrolase domain-containing protein [Actinocrispum sp. NPDC049592]|uniref:serine hydrolase domain-containing protein n=1 Tax=Actinocrispum sp. NPDC049592 TaxID=3154835 RepID=UPI0034195C7F
MRKAAIAAIAAAAVALTAVPAQAACLPKPNDKALTAALATVPSADVTGALVRITGSAGDWSGTSGYSDTQSHTPVNPDGLFRIGSATKTFTAVMVLQLAQEHRISLDAPVQRYLPGVLPASYPPVPVYTLLDHTAGLPSVDIPELYNPDWIIEHRYDHWSPEQVLATATKHPIDFTPGSEQKYTNTAYVTAGMIIQRVTGRSYADNLRDRIAAPLGLAHTYDPGDDPHLPNPAARGYITNTRGELVDVTEMNQSIPGAAGAVISTAADLDKFITGLFRGRLLDRPMTNRLFTLPKVKQVDGTDAAYSQGLMKVTVDGMTVWGKTGSRYGYSSGVFATRDLARKLIYSVNPTVKSPDGQPLVVRQIAAAAAAK